ncbi:MAG: FtsW/RodA/SpoVE family cell cycle protein [Eubacterium sp.]
MPERLSSQDSGKEKIVKSKKSLGIKKSDIFLVGSIDIPFLALTIVLLTIGLVMLFSASYPYAYYEEDSSYYYFVRQLIFAVIGLIAMFVMSKVNYKLLKIIVKPLLVITIISLIVVLFYHTDISGSDGSNFKRWIPIFGFTFQPSDLAKFTIILTMASYISDYYRHMKKFKYGIVYPLAIIAVFCGLIVLEHHVSCTILMFLIGASLMFAGGSDWRLFAFGVGVIVLVVFVVIAFPDLLQNYVGVKIEAWLNKDFEPTGARWQINNSLYAIGSGGLFGVGLGNSKQKYLYVSQPQNDFIFSIVCEELGFIRCAIIIALFAALVIRGLIIAARCKDKFGSLLTVGVVAQIGLQVAFNILVVTDTIPNTGIALPFFSYGGTAIMMMLFQIGVVLSVSRKANQKKVQV